MPRGEAGIIDRGFQPAIEYFRAKVNLPTRTWRDVWQGQHTRAFVVAGAMREDLLTDLREAVDKAIADGESFDRFRARFDEIVAKHGWQHTGSPGWRSRVIYQTNLRTAFMAGRYAQMRGLVDQLPYWQYDHTTLQNPREQHRAWDGLVLRWDDPWWQAHYPPNGWGCNCRVRPLSERQLRKLGKAGPDAAPGGGSGDVPEEWRYHVGEAAYGLPPQKQRMLPAGSSAWRDEPGGASWIEAGRPERLPARPVRGQDLHVDSAQALAQALIAHWGDERKVFTVRGDDGFRYDLVADAALLAGHLDAGKRRFAGYLDDALGDPDELWLAWVRSRTTGKLALRLRAIRAVAQPDGRVLMVVVDGQRGELVSYTLFPRDKQDQINALRRGRLIYARAGGVPDAGQE